MWCSQNVIKKLIFDQHVPDRTSGILKSVSRTVQVRKLWWFRLTHLIILAIKRSLFYYLEPITLPKSQYTHSHAETIRNDTIISITMPWLDTTIHILCGSFSATFHIMKHVWTCFKQKWDLTGWEHDCLVVVVEVVGTQ